MKPEVDNRLRLEKTALCQAVHLVPIATFI